MKKRMEFGQGIKVWVLGIKGMIKGKLNSMTLASQLALLISVVFSMVILSLILFNYKSNSATIMTQQTEITSSMLRLESQNIDAYFGELDRYSLLLRQNSSFMNILNSRVVMDYHDTSTISNLLASQFDNRNDLLSYRIFLTRKDPDFEITKRKHMVQNLYHVKASALPFYDSFTAKPDFMHMVPSPAPGTLCTYYRTIIRIEDQHPLAIIELTVDDSYLSSLAGNYVEDGEYLIMLDSNYQLFYSSSPKFADTNLLANVILDMKKKQPDQNYLTMQIDGVSYLAVFHESESRGYHLLSLKPQAAIQEQIAATRNISLILAFLAISLSVILAIVFIRLITKPLSTLSHRLQKVGGGNFTQSADISGSVEIANLAENYNSMILHINDLINKNYVSEINEKTARLIALEAQLNPHFLYNTLQVISTEAILSGNKKIPSMVNAIASMLRYSIKDGDFSFLEQEMKYVSDYLFLQQSRFEEHLEYEFEIQENTKKQRLPKISILTLVENSILHGMEEEVSQIRIHVKSRLEHDSLIITVQDNGCGMAEEKLAALRSHLTDSLTRRGETGIGLVNLYSRLTLLYNGLATMTIESRYLEGTCVTLIIPVTTDNRSTLVNKELAVEPAILPSDSEEKLSQIGVNNV